MSGRAWPWVVYAAAMGGVALMELLVVWQWRSGQPCQYGYWLESAAGAASYGAVGALIAARVPGNRMGPLMLVAPIGAAVQGLSGITAQVGATHGWPVPVVTIAGGLFSAAQATFVGVAVLLLFLAPDGRPWNRFWRVVVRFVSGLVVIGVVGGFLMGPDLGTPGAPSSQALACYPPNAALLSGVAGRGAALLNAGAAVLVASIPVAMVALVQRWWQSPPVERRQVAWPVLGAIATPVVIVVGSAIGYPVIYHGDPVWALALTLLPLGIAIGVFRHGLYGLDRVVSRTVSYTLVTGVVVTTYAVVVTVASNLLPVAGQLPVALATLAAAAVGQPALRRVRRLVDRRFDRERINAQQAVERFGAGLTGMPDLGRTEDDLVGVVRRVFGPSSVTVWTTGNAEPPVPVRPDRPHDEGST